MAQTGLLRHRRRAERAIRILNAIAQPVQSPDPAIRWEHVNGHETYHTNQN